MCSVRVMKLRSNEHYCYFTRFYNKMPCTISLCNLHKMSDGQNCVSSYFISCWILSCLSCVMVPKLEALMSVLSLPYWVLQSQLSNTADYEFILFPFFFLLDLDKVLNYFQSLCKSCHFDHVLPMCDEVPTWLSIEDYCLSGLLSPLLQRPVCEAAPCCRAGLPPTLPCTCLLRYISATIYTIMKSVCTPYLYFKVIKLFACVQIP